MRHLNYNHLFYFWTVARDGTIAKAARDLHLTPQTISGQLKLLEDSVGVPLFERVGRRLVMTEAGRVVNQYADEIFTLGAELSRRMRGQQTGSPRVFSVGIVNSIAKLIAHRIVAPVHQLADPIRIVCWEADIDRLLADLAIHRLDIVLADRPMPQGLSVKAYNHRLGESGVSLFADKRRAAALARGFPGSLNGAPMLMPTNNNPLRRQLDDWLEREGIAANIVGEFEDTALLKAFGKAGRGVFPGPTAIASEIEQMYAARRIGDVAGVTETYFAISPERKMKHPAAMCITETARSNLFG